VQANNHNYMYTVYVLIGSYLFQLLINTILNDAECLSKVKQKVSIFNIVKRYPYWYVIVRNTTGLTLRMKMSKVLISGSYLMNNESDNFITTVNKKLGRHRERGRTTLYVVGNFAKSLETIRNYSIE